ncbi:porin [Moritella marina]|uniref:porin n=1 Tax=Moritella marina TaxID=90736 RepID=UPI003703BC2D
MLKKTALAIALSSLFVGTAAQAVTIYDNDNGDSLKLYGEVGVGGHFGADYEYGEFYEDQSYIDDTFATLGVKGNYQEVYYRLEVDYERENWKYGSGDMVLAIDKAFIGYNITSNHAVEVGLTDTAFDDYDKYGDFTFDTTVETGEAGDQANTIKYQGKFKSIKMGASYSYEAESSSGSALGDVVNGYVGYFGKELSAVVGMEMRAGSNGVSKYGEQTLYGFGMRYNINEKIALGVNAFLEKEDISPTDKSYKTNPDGTVVETTVYRNYAEQENKGALVSARYKIADKWELTGSHNYEEYEKWDQNSDQWDTKETEWGSNRTWQTIGVNFKPSSSVIFSFEKNFGESAQSAYAYARVYF